MTPIEKQIQEKLQVLAPLSLELRDESGQHIGHPGAASGGGHYQLTLVCPAFSGKNRLARHRMIYAALGELMHGPIHALAIDAFAPDEL